MSDPFFARTLERLTDPASGYAQTFDTVAAEVDLGIGEARYPLPADVRAELGDAVADMDRHWYADPAGDTKLRTAYVQRLYGMDRLVAADMDQVLVTGGGKEAAWLAVRYLLNRTRAGSALVPRPGWEPYVLWLDAAGGSAVPYAPAELAADPTLLSELIDAAEPRPSLLVLNYPHNPTGVHVDQATMDAIIETANDLSLAVVSDEVYRAFAPGNVSAAHAPTYDPSRQVVVDSCSKWLTTAGLRVGFLLAAPTIVQDLTLFRASYASCASPVTQRIAQTLLTSRAAARWLTHTRTSIDSTRRATATCLVERGVPVACEGGLYVWCRPSSPDALPAALGSGGPRARITDGVVFGAPGHVRICPARAGLDPAAAADAVLTTLRGR